MSVPLWVSETANHFWAQVGEPEPFPRLLRHSITVTFPVAMVELSPLWTHTVCDWLRNLGVPCESEGPDRPLRACLVARAGLAFLFLDSHDPPEEQRFSLAHELAHFLRDYHLPRQLAIQKLGPGVVDILDGNRPATPEERLHSVLRNVPLGLHVHLMRRNEDGEAIGSVAQVESDADRLAWELLAPARHVLANVSDHPCHERMFRTVYLLEQDHGLPHQQALRYARTLFPSTTSDDPLLGQLRKTLGNLSSFPPPDGK